MDGIAQHEQREYISFLDYDYHLLGAWSGFIVMKREIGGAGRNENS